MIQSHNIHGQFQRAPIWLVAVLCALVLFFDIGTPNELAAGIVYIPLVFLTLWFSEPRSIFLFTIFVTLLTIAGFFATQPYAVMGSWLAVSNRLLSIAALWSVALVIYLRRKSESGRRATLNQLRSIVNNAVDGLITINQHGLIQSFNPACEKIFGYTAEEVLQKNIKMLMPEPYHSEHDDYIANYHRTGIPKIMGKGREVRGRRKDGSVFPMDLSVSEFQFQTGRHFAGIIRDITDRKEAEKHREQLRQAQKMEALGQLTGGIAHDFNNLLAIILGNLDFMVERTKKEDPLRQFIHPSIEAAEHGAELTKQLLAFGRKQPLMPKTIDPNELLHYFTSMVRNTLGAQIEIVLVLEEKLWNLHVDPTQLQNALLNLAVNARDAMPNGGKLIIEAKNIAIDDEYTLENPEMKPGDYITIAISDTGTGMTADVIEKAFEPFFTTKKLGKGSGLGLSMVYGFVRQSAGHVKLYSEVGLGTTIRIYLPRVEGEAVHTEHTFVRAAVPATATILVVEDNEEVLKMTSAMAESIGYTVLQASNGEAALEVLKAHPEVELLLTDVMMPGKYNGPALVREALVLRPKLKVLFNSGYAEHAIMQSGMLQEGTHLIGKPFRKQQLADKLYEILNES